MEMPAEFRKLTKGFRQDMAHDNMSLEDMVDGALLAIEPEDVGAAQAYIDELLGDKYDDEALVDVWRNSRADIHFTEGAGVRMVLRTLRTRMDTHPYLNRD